MSIWWHKFTWFTNSNLYEFNSIKLIFFLQCYIKMIVTSFSLNCSMFPQFNLNSWFLSVKIIYLDSRNLMWTRKKQSYHQFRYTCIYHRCELWTIVWGIMREWSYYMYLTVTNLSIFIYVRSWEIDVEKKTKQM